MSWTKEDYINAAFEEIGLAVYVFDLQPEQMAGALKKLDSLMASWNAKGIRVGYPLPNSPSDSRLDQETNVPDAANEAIYLNLALRLAPTVGKVISQQTRVDARRAYKTLLVKVAEVEEMQLHDLPRGAGNKPWRYGYLRFIDRPRKYLTVGNDARLDLEG